MKGLTHMWLGGDSRRYRPIKEGGPLAIGHPPSCGDIHPRNEGGQVPQRAYGYAMVTLPSRDETRERSADHRCRARPVLAFGPVSQRHGASSVRLSDPEAGMHSYHRALHLLMGFEAARKHASAGTSRRTRAAGSGKMDFCTFGPVRAKRSRGTKERRGSVVG